MPTGSMSSRARRAFSALAVLAASVVVLRAAELRPQTSAAYDRYIRVSEAQMDARVKAKALLDIDQWPEARRNDIYARLHQGEIYVERSETKDGTKAIDVPNGMIQDWRGIVWLPGVPLARVLALAQDHEHYTRVFAPAIQASRVAGRDGDVFTIEQRFVLKHILSGVVNTSSTVTYTRLDAGRELYLRSRSTRVAEVADAGTPNEHELPIGRDSGYLWRANAYWQMEEREGGTFLQCEWITLSRDLPFGLGLFISPIVRGVARDTAEHTLIAVRAALAKPPAG